MFAGRGAVDYLVAAAARILRSEDEGTAEPELPAAHEDGDVVRAAHAGRQGAHRIARPQQGGEGLARRAWPGIAAARRHPEGGGRVWRPAGGEAGRRAGGRGREYGCAQRDYTDAASRPARCASCHRPPLGPSVYRTAGEKT